MNDGSDVDVSAAAMARAKRGMRMAIRARLAARGPAALEEAGVAVARHLAPLLPSTGVVALFASRPAEVSTQPLDGLVRERGLRRAVPRMVTTADGKDALTFVVVDDDLALADLPRDRHGIPTPEQGDAVLLVDCALVVVPGLAFDVGGGRLGHGRGYYDRALGDGQTGVADGVIVGILDDCQWVDAVPRAPWDRLLPRLASPERGLITADAAALPRG